MTALLTQDELPVAYFTMFAVLALEAVSVVERYIYRKYPKPTTRRPRVIVTLSRTKIPKEIRDSVRKELLGDTERDYVIVEAISDTAVTALEIR